MSAEKKRISDFIRELFPDLTVHVAFPHERLEGVEAIITDAHGQEVALGIRLQMAKIAANSYEVAAMMRIPLADEALNILVYNPDKISHTEPYEEFFTLAHEAAHAGIDRLINVDEAIRKSFPECGQMRTMAKDFAAIEKEYSPLGEKAMNAALNERMLSEADTSRMEKLDGQLSELEKLMDKWDEFRTPFINQHTLDYLKGKGIEISEKDIPAFKERVSDLFARVIAARKIGDTSPQQIFEARADATIINALQSTALSAKPPELKQSILDHYSTDVLDAAAREPHAFDDLSGCKLLEACVVFAGKHFKPTQDIAASLQAAEQKGLMVASWRGSSVAAGKILFTMPRTDPLCALASRFAQAHFRECERRDELLRPASRARLTNNIIKRYYAALVRYGR